MVYFKKQKQGGLVYEAIARTTAVLCDNNSYGYYVTIQNSSSHVHIHVGYLLLGGGRVGVPAGLGAGEDWG